MIERIYIDNFRTLVNFEWKPGRLVLLLGDNGAGKSTLVDVLAGLRSLIVDRQPVQEIFPSHSRTRWDTRLEQRVEIDLVLDGRPFSYQLQIAHSPEDGGSTLPRTQVRSETLRTGDVTLADFQSGELQLHSDDGTRGPKVKHPDTISALASIGAGPQSKLLSAFKTWMDEWLVCFFPDPRRMSSRTDAKADRLARDVQNFASWYPLWLASDFTAAAAATAELKQVMPGLDSLNVNRRTLRLEAKFLTGGAAFEVDWAELSDGQRQLVSLYAILHGFLGRAATVILDEPDNYVALREIQPWLSAVIRTALTEGGPQVWLLSHHPELFDMLAREFGQQLVRIGGGPTRIEPFPDTDGLRASELVAGGWNHE